jgi:trk system potassium uptake protein TrkA
VAFDVVPFLDGAVRIASFRLRSESPLIGQKLMDVDRAQGGARTLVVGVEQADGTVLIPNGGYVFQPLDRISLLLLAGQDLSPSFRLMGVKYRQEGRIVIGGGGKLGLYIARKLEAAGYAPVVIENGRDRCAMLAQQLNNSIVLCGDLTDAELLTDEAENADNFIALTGHQEVNFLVSLLARKVGARRAITLMDNEAYLGMAATMGIDATISPKQSAVGTIFRVIRQSTVLDAALLMNGKLDALLVEVQAGSVLTRGPLKDAALPKGVVAALAERGGQLLVPDGNFTYLPKDKALFVTLRETMSMVDGLVAAKKG